MSQTDREAKPILRGPIQWFGGKSQMVSKLLKLIPSHHTYVEPFGGGASLLFAKPPSKVEVYNDIDSGIVGFFRVLRDPVLFAQFHRLVSLTPYSREEYYYCRDTWGACIDEVDRAYHWYVVARMSFGGYFGHSWGSAITHSRRGMAGTASYWLSTIDRLPAIQARLMRVQIEHADFRDILRRYDMQETLFYCDPPYVSSTRRSGKYKHEMSDGDHEELVDILLGLKGKALLSAYPHEIYTPLAKAGWAKREFKAVCCSVAKTRATGILGRGAATKMQPRTEVVWISPQTEQDVAEEISFL